MQRLIALVPALLALMPATLPAFTLQLDSTAFAVTPMFSDVTQFSIRVDVDMPLAPGRYENPVLATVSYTVTGTLAPGTRSGQGSLALSRSVSGAEFYQQGGGLVFEVSPDLDPGGVLTAAALAGHGPEDGVVFTFNAREIGTGQFHAPILVLRAGGTGIIANADNLVSVIPLTLLEIGEEYVSTLTFDPAALVLSGRAPTEVPLPARAMALCACAIGGAGIIGISSRR